MLCQCRRCPACGDQVWFASAHARLLQRRCPLCSKEQLPCAELLGVLPPLPLHEQVTAVRAEYGDPADSAHRIDVTEAMRRRVQATGGRYDVHIGQLALLPYTPTLAACIALPPGR